MKKLIGSLAVVLVAIFGLASPAAAQYPPTVLVVVVTPSTAPPGATVVVVVTGCRAGETVSVTVNNVTVTVSCAGAGGTSGRLMQATGGTATANIKAPTTPGTYTVTATGLTSGLRGSATLTVAAATTPAAPAAPAGGGGLPTTGSDSTPTMWIAGTAVLVGAGLVGVAWKRRRHPVGA